MYKISRQLLSPYSQALLYDIVNDTEAYQEFVPFCSDSEVIKDAGIEKICRLVFSKGLLSRSLVTRNVLVPNQQINIHLVKGDFSHLTGQWIFTPQESGTIVSLEFEYAFNHPVIEYTVGQFFKSLTTELIDVFCKRAETVSIR